MKVALYTADGDLVRTIASDKALKKGAHKLAWDGKDGKSPKNIRHMGDSPIGQVSNFFVSGDQLLTKRQGDRFCTVGDT